jgi:hypothetical protein
LATCDRQLKSYLAILPDRKVESEKAVEAAPQGSNEGEEADIQEAVEKPASLWHRG